MTRASAPSPGDKVHTLIDGIYKNIIDSYNPGVKQLISTGRAYQKALHNVASAAEIYIDCIYTLAQSAQTCRGQTKEMGAALMQIAEVHREINTQIVDNIKSFHAELLIPLETKQEKEAKQLQLTYKKYMAGYKFYANPLEKAQNALKKQKKKNKAAKFGFDQKEYQILQEVQICQTKLSDYRIQCLQRSLNEERRSYCFLLERLCALVQNYASHHNKARELLTHRLNEWSPLCSNSHVLPQESENLLYCLNQQQDKEGIEFRNNAGVEVSSRSNDLNEHEARSKLFSVSGAKSAPASLLQGISGGLYPNEEDPYISQSAIRIRNPPPQSRPRMEALYSYQGIDNTQLSFNTGDILALIGEKNEGWHYGENLSNNLLGWFPVAFAKPIVPNSGMGARVQSLNNLTKSADAVSSGKTRHIMDRTISEHHLALQRSDNSNILNEFVPICSVPNLLDCDDTTESDYYKIQQLKRTYCYPPPNIDPPPPPDTSPTNMHYEWSTNYSQINLRRPSTTKSNREPEYGILSTSVNTTSMPSHHPSPSISSSGYSGSSNLTTSIGQNSILSLSMKNVDNLPLPPPPPLPHQQCIQRTDNPQDEKDNHERSNPFLNVKLRKAVTNDRSAPRIH